ncbi:DUF937 domain-containing protein [Sphingobacterium suaedae]|uniref:DUF937 domain-containing protein n=1 Tax=Sphingobacterium suaedae TaxID=1686402 RepID=A0ABW5KBT7_9SPHI
MKNILIDATEALFTPDMLNKIAMNVQQTPGDVKKGLDYIIPTVLLALQRKDQQTLHLIVDRAKSTFGGFDAGNVFDNGDSTLEYMTAPHLLHDELQQQIFGGNAHIIFDTLQHAMGVPAHATNVLLSATLPAVFSVLSRGGSDWRSDHIRNVLQDNQLGIQDALSPDLNTLTVDTRMDHGMHTGVPPVTVADAIIDPTHTSPRQGSDNRQSIVHTPETVGKQQRRSNVWWIIVLGLLIAAWFFFGRGCQGKNDPSTERDTLQNQ